MLNDKDKEYLKQNVEKKIDNLDKKLDSKKSSATNPQKAKSLNELYKDKKEDKDKLLEALQEREKKGENTLAQKIEMLNLTIKKSLPEEFKDGVKAMTTTMKQGGSQALKGVDSIISKIASVNPMLAMLYSGGKDISKAAWNITAGTAKMGFGLAKGIGQGTAGILKSAFNLFNRRKKQEEETDDKLGKVEDVLPKSSKEESGNEEDYELSTAKKIDEIHKAVVVDLKKNNELQQSEEKKRHSVLSKGLAGMGKTMKAISEVTELIMAKQKLILGGLMIGALGVLALVGWFKNGGLENLMKKLLHNPMEDVIDDSFDNRDATQSQAFQVDANASALSSWTGETQQKIFEKHPDKLTGIASTNTTKSKALDANGNSIDLTKMDFTTGDLTPVLAPYDGAVNTLNKQTNMSQGKAVNVRWVMVISAKETEKYPALKISNLIYPQLKANDQFKKGDILAYATSSFSMENYWGFEDSKMENLKDYQTEVNKAKENNYKDNLQRIAETKTQKKTEELEDFMFHKDRASYDAQHGMWDGLKNGEGHFWGDVGEKVHDAFHGKDQDIQRNRWKTEQNKASTEFLKNNILNDKNKSNVETESPSITNTQIPISNTNTSNKTDNTVAQQAKAIQETREKELQAKAENKKEKLASAGGNSTVVVNQPSKDANLQPSGLFNSAQYAAANSETA